MGWGGTLHQTQAVSPYEPSKTTLVTGKGLERVPKHPNIHPPLHASMHPSTAGLRVEPASCLRAHLGTVRVRSGRGGIAGKRSSSGQASADGLAGTTEKKQSSAEKNCGKGGRRRKEEGWSSSDPRTPRAVSAGPCPALREFPSRSGKTKVMSGGPVLLPYPWARRRAALSSGSSAVPTEKRQRGLLRNSWFAFGGELCCPFSVCFLGCVRTGAAFVF